MLKQISKIAVSSLALVTFSSLVDAGPVGDGRYEITSRHSGLVLEVQNGSNDNGANVIQWTANGFANQHFDVTDLGNGYYSVRPAHSGKSLDVYGWDPDPGAEIRQWDYSGFENQQWQITEVAPDYYTIVSRFNGLALDVWEWSTVAGGDIRQWTPTGSFNQQWSFQSVGGGIPPTSGKGSSCVSTGSVTVNATIVVDGGVYDGGCRTFNPTSAVGDGSQAEGQDPVFRLENGATLRNVIIGQNGADGIHIYNGGTVENIRWTNVGEDALTVKSQGDVVIRNVEGFNGSDKFLQVNAPTNMTVSNCIVDNMGKFVRQNGGTTFPMTINVNNCDISNMSEGIFRSDSSSSTARITNSRRRNAGSVCIGAWASCTSSNLTNF